MTLDLPRMCNIYETKLKLKLHESNPLLQSEELINCELLTISYHTVFTYLTIRYIYMTCSRDNVFEISWSAIQKINNFFLIIHSSMS